MVRKGDLIKVTSDITPCATARLSRGGDWMNVADDRVNHPSRHQKVLHGETCLVVDFCNSAGNSIGDDAGLAIWAAGSWFAIVLHEEQLYFVHKSFIKTLKP